MLNSDSKTNIRFRILCVISFALIISTIVLSSVIAWNEGMALKNAQAANGQSLASFIAKLSKDALVMKDGIQLDAIVNEATKEDIVYTLIRDEQDHILTSQYASINYRSPRFTAILSGLPRDIELPEIIEAIKKKESISEISVPIMFDFMPIGKITIGISDYRIRQQIEKSILFVIAINLVVALVLGVVLFIASKKIVLDPIAELARATSTLGSGDLSVRVNVETSGEIRSLVDSFNQMLGNLEKATVSKEYMDKIIDSMIDTLIVVSGDRKILLANSAALALLGYEEKELAGQPFDIVIEDGPAQSERIMDEILSKGFIGNLEAEYRTKDGRRISMLFSGSTMAGKHNVTGIVCVAKDITKIKELEEELQKLRKLESVGLLAGGIAHDFNNLLQGVFGYISMARISVDDREKALAVLGKAEMALNNAVSLTGQLLTFSMGGKPVKKRVALPAVIENSVRFRHERVPIRLPDHRRQGSVAGGGRPGPDRPGDPEHRDQLPRGDAGGGNRGDLRRKRGPSRGRQSVAAGGWEIRPDRHQGLGHGDLRAASVEDFRALLHDETERERPRTGDVIFDRQEPRRHDRRGVRSGQRQHLLHLSAGEGSRGGVAEGTPGRCRCTRPERQDPRHGRRGTGEGRGHGIDRRPRPRGGVRGKRRGQPSKSSGRPGGPERRSTS